MCDPESTVYIVSKETPDFRELHSSRLETGNLLLCKSIAKIPVLLCLTSQ